MHFPTKKVFGKHRDSSFSTSQYNMKMGYVIRPGTKKTSYPPYPTSLLVSSQKPQRGHPKQRQHKQRRGAATPTWSGSSPNHKPAVARYFCRRIAWLAPVVTTPSKIGSLCTACSISISADVICAISIREHRLSCPQFFVSSQIHGYRL
jgi:hypothetical protein